MQNIKKWALAEANLIPVGHEGGVGVRCGYCRNGLVKGEVKMLTHFTSFSVADSTSS